MSRPTASLVRGGPREAAPLGLGVPSELAPQTWAPPEPLTLTLRGIAHLPDPQETPGPPGDPRTLEPAVRLWQRGGRPVSSGPVGELWGLLVRQSPLLLSHLTHCPQRRPASGPAPCSPLWRPRQDPFPGAELGSILGFHPLRLPRPHPSLQSPSLNFCKPSPVPVRYLTSSIPVEFCPEQMACGP